VENKHNERQLHPVMALSDVKDEPASHQNDDKVGRQLMSTFLRQVCLSHAQGKSRWTMHAYTNHQLFFVTQILESAKALHEIGIVHRDIKPANVMCETNLDLVHIQSLATVGVPQVHCVLGDFSSAFNDFASRNLYTRGPSRLEQTDEYAPPEAIFGYAYNDTTVGVTPSFDSWSIGIVALELLLGTPNVFSVDQRTR
jgi:serine/threonine protein kinase